MRIRFPDLEYFIKTLFIVRVIHEQNSVHLLETIYNSLPSLQVPWGIPNEELNWPLSDCDLFLFLVNFHCGLVGSREPVIDKFHLEGCFSDLFVPDQKDMEFFDFESLLELLLPLLSKEVFGA